MAAAGWKGSVAFGPLIRFNVRAAAVDRETTFAFNMHHAADGGRLRSQLGICEQCGEEVQKDDVVKGFKGSWPVDVGYLESLELEKSAVMEIDGLVPAEQIEPRWYKREYDVLPEKGAEQPYVLFLKLLERAGRVAIGKVVMGGKEAIVTIRPRDGVLAMDLMWWPDEIRSNADAKASVAGIEVSDQMLAIGDQLVKMMAKDFKPEAYKNEYAVAVAQYLETLQSGQTAPTIEKRAVPTTSQSLEDALAATLAALGGQVAEKVATKTGKKTKAA
ncbi:MAG: Ku protein [Limnohabitans sp.]